MQGRPGDSRGDKDETGGDLNATTQSNQRRNTNGEHLNNTFTILQRLQKPSTKPLTEKGKGENSNSIRNPINEGQRQGYRGEYNAATGAINGEGGWSTVLNKRRRNYLRQSQINQSKATSHPLDTDWGMGKPTNRRKERFLTGEVKKMYQAAFNEKRCLRCLSKGHKRFQCREPIRCYKCKCSGHQAGSCRGVNAKAGNVIKPVRRHYPTHTSSTENRKTYAQIVKNLQTQQNTEPLSQMEVEPFADVRPHMTQVFAPTREFLRPQNEFLDSTGMIVMVQGGQSPDLPREIARVLARRFGWLWQDYHVMQAADAPFLVICPGPNIKESIIHGGVYTVRPGVQFRVIDWAIDLDMAYEPTPFEAWIRLTGLPYQAWNNTDLRKVTTQLGHVTAVAPYGRARGHFRHIILRIACEDPRELPMHVKYHEGDFATIVRVRLLNWRPYGDQPFPLQPGGGGGDRGVRGEEATNTSIPTQTQTLHSLCSKFSRTQTSKPSLAQHPTQVILAVGGQIV